MSGEFDVPVTSFFISTSKDRTLPDGKVSVVQADIIAGGLGAVQFYLSGPPNISCVYGST
jgi:hypothetical protein